MPSDLAHWWGGDLSLSPTGDILTVENLDKDNQRIVRRICTNGKTSGALLGEYVFHPEYGGSAPWYIGRAKDGLMLQGIIRSQMYEEASVSHNPEPQIGTQLFPDGTFIATIQYADEQTGNLLPPLSFQVA